MSLEDLEQDRAALQAVLDDFNSGQLRLEHGQEEFVADLKRRIRNLDEMIARPRRPGQA